MAARKTTYSSQKVPALLRGIHTYGAVAEPPCVDAPSRTRPHAQRQQVDHRNVQQVVEHRHPAEHLEHPGDRAARAVGKRHHRDRGTQRHQQEHLRRRVLPLIQRRRINGGPSGSAPAHERRRRRRPGREPSRSTRFESTARSRAPHSRVSTDPNPYPRAITPIHGTIEYRTLMVGPAVATSPPK